MSVFLDNAGDQIILSVGDGVQRQARRSSASSRWVRQSARDDPIIWRDPGSGDLRACAIESGLLRFQ